MADFRERTRLSRALNELDLRIHSRLSTDEVMQSTLDGFVAALGADAGDIKLFSDDEWVVRYVCGFGPDVIGLRLSIPDAPVASRVRRLREPVVIADYHAEPAGTYVGFPLVQGLRSALAVPLIIRQDVVGCLFAWMREDPRAFSAGEVDFARRVAASVALGLENARLFEAERAARQLAEAAERRLGRELERNRVLLRASDELLTTTDPDELIRRLAGLVLDATGIARVFVNLIDMNERVLTPKFATGGLAAPAGSEIPFDRLSETALRAIAGGQPTVLDYERPDVTDNDRAIAGANAARVVLFVPLIHRDTVVGHISLDQPGARHDFSPDQIRVVSSIAAQAAVALQNARLFEREHRIAETLQQAILTPPETIESLEVGYLYQPASESADVGGDIYDVVDLGEGRVALMIGDVAGKGIEAARLTTLLRDGVRAHLLEDAEPASVFARVNELLYRFTPPEGFATAFLGVLDCSTGVLRSCGAGHPPPVITGRGAPRVLEPGACLLGAFPHAEFTSQQTVLAPGETLCMFTDGVTEARRDGSMFGEEGVVDALRRLDGVPAARLPDALLEQVVAFSEGELRDDIVILCAARTGVGA